MKGRWMDRAFSLPLTAAIIGTTAGYIAKRYFDALEGYDDSEFMDSVDLPPELARDATMIPASPRHDEWEP